MASASASPSKLSFRDAAMDGIAPGSSPVFALKKSRQATLGEAFAKVTMAGKPSPRPEPRPDSSQEVIVIEDTPKSIDRSALATEPKNLDAALRACEGSKPAVAASKPAVAAGSKPAAAASKPAVAAGSKPAAAASKPAVAADSKPAATASKPVAGAGAKPATAVKLPTNNLSAAAARAPEGPADEDVESDQEADVAKNLGGRNSLASGSISSDKHTHAAKQLEARAKKAKDTVGVLEKMVAVNEGLMTKLFRVAFHMCKRHDVLDEKELEAIKASDFLSVTIDESTDRSVHHHLAIYISYMDEYGDVIHRFRQHERIQGSATSQKLFDILQTALKEDGIDMTKIVGFTSDGANVMVGEHKGVATLMKAACPGLLSFHCVAHKLALSCADLFKDYEELRELDSVFSKVYGYFKNSSLRREDLKNLQQEMEAKEYALLKPHV
ncbi:hypothetical protein GPECTOR_5000g1285 [Gonium pectorale]|nr:hypothetical protein GPECTOR_5000g1285 [Gonium pectorale]|eukprot:KXZ57058.1 hypothetical protein GPECTOR_5000g1285 [Gonium pectorale]